MQDIGASDWYDETRRCTLRLARIRSVSPSTNETDAAREVLRLLHEDGLAHAYAASGLDPVADDLYTRHNAYAFLQGHSRDTIVLMGHLDTVDTADYGALEPWALDPQALGAREEVLAAIPRVTEDLAAHPGDWLFGRGVADMKSGVAALIVVMRRLARQAREGALPLSVVLLATVDEENESAGVLQAVRFLTDLRARYNLTFLGAINTDYTTAHYPGDPHRYIYRGTIGKLLPSFFVVGSAAHAGDPFDGLDANLIAAELVRDLSMNADLCDSAGGQTASPPVTLHATDLKERYDTQLPFAAYLYVNVLTLTTGPTELLGRLRDLAATALRRVLARVDTEQQRWVDKQESSIEPAKDCRLDANAGTFARAFGPREDDIRPSPGSPAAHWSGGKAKQPRSGVVLTYAELREETIARMGKEQVDAALAGEWDRWPATLDRRERCLYLVRRLWTLSGRHGPAVVLYYSPPYYPHVAPSPCALHEAVAATAAAHPELNLALHDYFPLLSDLSYLRLDEGIDLSGLAENMPVWSGPDAPVRPGSYTLPFTAMRALGLPVVNLGPYGRGVHQRGERVLMSYAFGVLPGLIWETIERLGSQ